jgi:type IV pilus assembly protein PilB
VTSRLKILSELDISERRLPQDGRFKMTFSDNRTIECRVSTCPTLFGEKIVIRVVDRSKDEMCIDELGLEASQKATFIKALTQPQGLILVTGPTGSGKTLSLYSALNLLNVPEINISTVENPVERYLPGINQINIHPKAGLTFPSILRSLLRQDPDIIMVGEVRDLETAEIAYEQPKQGI